MAVCVVSVGLTGSIAPRQVMPLIRVLQMNLCGSGIAGCYTSGAVAAAADVIRDIEPDVVTLNEVCENDVLALGQALAAHRGGSVVRAFHAARDRRTGHDFRCRNGQPYGIGLVVHSPIPRPGGPRYGGLYPMQDVRDPEERAWLCLDTAVGVLACTTHLAYIDPAVAQAQCRYLLGVAIPSVHARHGYVPTVVGGDLNLRSSGAPAVRPCLPSGYRGVDDGSVQHVLVTTEFAVRSTRLVDMAATTDHPGLLVVFRVRHSGARHRGGAGSRMCTSRDARGPTGRVVASSA